MGMKRKDGTTKRKWDGYLGAVARNRAEQAERNQEVIWRLDLIKQGVPRDEAIRIAAKWAREGRET